MLSLILFCTNVAWSQSHGVSLSINDSNTGTAFHIDYIKQGKARIHYGGGARLHLNPKVDFGNGGTFDHTFYAKDFNQRIGLNAFLEYQFKIKKWKVDPFVGYHTQVLRTARKVVRQPNTDPILFEWDDPMTAWNNMLVLGLNYDLTEKFSLKAHSGFGFSSLYNIDRRVLLDDRTPNNNNSWQGNMSFNLGMTYWFKSK